MIEIVSATRLSEADFWAKQPLAASLQRLKIFSQITHHVTFDNRRGLPEVYNARIETSQEDLLLFIHDDVWIDDIFLLQRVWEGLSSFDVIGLAGCRKRVPRQPAWSFIEHGRSRDTAKLSGMVAHGQSAAGPIMYFGPAPSECELLDGLFLAAPRAKLVSSGVRFDPRFDFHFYDLDFCRTARERGLRLGTWPISVTHATAGNFETPAWETMYAAYLDKWRS